MKYFFTLIIFFVPLFSASIASPQASNHAIKFSKTSPIHSLTLKTDTTSSINNNVDSTTSPSQLKAKKSHFVSSKDETGLAIFFGLIVISILIVLLNPFKNR